MLGERRSPLSPLAKGLLAREREATEDAALQARALERARAAVEAGRTSGISFRTAATWPARGKPRKLWRALPLIAAAVAVAGLAAAGLGAYVLGADRAVPSSSLPPSPLPSPVVAVARSISTSAPALEPSENVAAEGANPSRPAAPPPESPRGAARQFSTEVKLLEPARTSIARGDYAAALVPLAKHQREFPNGELAQEREALRVRAMWGLGQKSAATAAAKAFRKRYPRSALLSWMTDESDPGP